MASEPSSAANAKRFREELDRIYEAHDGAGAELKFLSTVFAYLQQKEGFFGRANTPRMVAALVKKHCDRVASADAEPPQKAEEPSAHPSSSSAPVSSAPPDQAGPKEEPVEEAQPAGPPPPGNGGKTDRFVWKQTLAEVTMEVPVPPETRGKDVRVSMTDARVKVSVKGSELASFDAPVWKGIIPDESTWIIDRSGGAVTLIVTLKKIYQAEWWPCVLQGDPEIDVRLIQPESSKLSDLDPEMRGTVEKMMFDQRQKQMNLPTSDELKKQEVIKRFMEQHPEMDFSGAKFS